MKNIVLLLSFVLCAGMGNKPPKPKPAVIENPIEVSSETPMLIIGKCTNCTPAELEFIRKAEGKMNETVASQCFQKQLSGLPLIQTNGLTPSQVAESLVHAGVRIDTEMYRTNKRVLGYTLPSAKKVWINRRYMLEWNVCDLGSLLAHEASHKIGYKHDYQATKRRSNSVPYSINFAFKSCCSK